MLLEYLVADPIYFFRFVTIIIVSITLHELGHGAAALYQGDDTPIESGHITLNPVVHMGWPSLIVLVLVGMAWGQMPVKPERFKDGAAGRMMVAAAGPMTNFALAALCILVLNTLARSSSSLVSPDFFYLAAYVNIGLGIFNMLPLPPLDGFNVFSEVFPSLQPIRNHPQAGLFFMMLFITGGLSFIWRAAEMLLRALV